VTKALKARKIKLSATEKNAILNAVSWYPTMRRRSSARS
jgi:type I restriction enzyme M protein